MSTVTTNDNSIKFGWRYGGNNSIAVPAERAVIMLWSTITLASRGLGKYLS